MRIEIKSPKNKFCLKIILVLVIAFAAFAPIQAKTITVCPSGCEYSSVQAAVDSASDGDTIIVRDGIYYENVNVNKRLTLKSENGPANCIVDASGSGSAITLSADGITIEGFTLRNSGDYPHAGVKVISSNNIISNNIISNNPLGIYLEYSSNNTIINNIAENNEYSIYLYSSSNNIILNNTISNDDRYGYGIYLYSSNNNSISNNNISNNYIGVNIQYYSSDDIIINNNVSNSNFGIFIHYYSSDNIISNNNVSNNYEGIILEDSSDNIITNNNVSNNHDGGIELWGSCNNNTISNNTLVNDGVSIWSSMLECWNTHTIEGNTVNGKPLYYFKNQIGGKVPEDAGQVILANCTGMILENLNISHTDVGIQLGFSSQNIINDNDITNNEYDGVYLYSSNNNIISNNNISNNHDGIELGGSCNNNTISNNTISSNRDCGIHFLGSSSGNIITNNNIASNNRVGISLYDSDYNVIYLNNFINNTYNAYSSSSTNIWNSPELITYTYNGKQYTNYLGNYWDDYTGTDSDGDGIGDTPYSIDGGDNDYYPLMQPWENFAPVTHPTISIYTDKSSYRPGDTQRLGLDVKNEDGAYSARIKIWIETPTGLTKMLLDKSLILPADLDYTKPNFKVFRVPNITPGEYTWHAQIINATTGEIVSESSTTWTLIATTPLLSEDFNIQLPELEFKEN